MRTAAGNKCLGASIDAGAAGKAICADGHARVGHQGGCRFPVLRTGRGGAGPRARKATPPVVAICADGRARVGHQGCCPFRGSENRAWRWGAGGAQGNSPSGPPARKVSGARTATPSIPRLPGRHPLAMRPQLLGESSPVELSPSNPPSRRNSPARPLTNDEGVKRWSLVSLGDVGVGKLAFATVRQPPGQYPSRSSEGYRARRPRQFVPPGDACGPTLPSAKGPRVRSPGAPSQGSRRRRRIIGAQSPGYIPCEGLRPAERQSDVSALRGHSRHPSHSYRSGRSHC